MRRHRRPRRVGEHRPGVDVDRRAGRRQREADRVLHPGVDGQHHDRGHGAADRHRDAAPPVLPRRQPIPAVEIQAEEDRLDEERVALEREGRPDQRPGEGHEARPEQAQLERQRRARHRADGEGDRGELGPDVRQPPRVRVLVADPPPLGDQHQHAASPRRWPRRSCGSPARAPSGSGRRSAATSAVSLSGDATPLWESGPHGRKWVALPVAERMAVIGRGSPLLVGSALTLLATFALRAAPPADRRRPRSRLPCKPPAAVDFARDVQPMLERHCYECHGTKKARGRLRLHAADYIAKGGADRAGRSSPGDAEQSLLMRRVLGLDGEDRMPLDADPLSDGELATLRGVDRSGRGAARRAGRRPTAAADVEEHWAYVKPVRPAAAGGVAAGLGAHADRSLRPRPARTRAARRRRPRPTAQTLLRRVTLDLTGLPPTLDGGRRVRSPTPRPTPTSASSIACSPRRTTASAGRGRGSTSPATPTPTATRRTAPRRSGRTATG